jgi:hypothetical protein
MAFSELSPKIHKISPSTLKITYDSKHTVWIETDLIDCDIKLAENGRVNRNERARMEVQSAIFGQMGFSAKCAIRSNKLFGQMGFRSNELSAKWVSAKRGRIDVSIYLSLFLFIFHFSKWLSPPFESVIHWEEIKNVLLEWATVPFSRQYI